MGVARITHCSPVSPLYTHHFSFSSWGEDQEDKKPGSVLNGDLCGDIMVIAAGAQKKLKMEMDKASHVQQGVANCHEQVQGILERFPALKAFMVSLTSKAKAGRDLQQRIQMALHAPISVLRMYEKVHKCEAQLLEGPRGDVGKYMQRIFMLKQLASAVETKCPLAIESLDELVQILRSSKTTGIDKFHLYKLNETMVALKTLQDTQEKVKPHDDLLNEAYEQLETEFRRILTDYGRPLNTPIHVFRQDGMFDPSFVPPPLLPAPMVQLLELIAANITSNGRLKNCLEIYEDVRSSKLYDNFDSLKPAYLAYMKPNALDSLQWAVLEEYIALWNRHMYIVVEILLKSERVLFDTIFIGLSIASPDCSACFGSLAMKSGLRALLDFSKAFAKSQKEPQKLFKLLDMFQTLDSLYPTLDELLHGDGCVSAREAIQELQKMIVNAACAVFWEFGLQVEVQREGGLPHDGGVLKLVSYVINYLKYLMSEAYRESIAEVLRIEQCWRGGAMEEVELPTVILHVMESLHRNVDSRSLMIEEPSLSCVLRMNNYWYIYTRCQNSGIGTLLGEDWLNKQREKVKHIAVQYEREAWSRVVSHLSMEGLKGSLNSNQTREMIRARIQAFQDALEDMHLKHSRWRFVSPELRLQIGDAVLDFIVPAYRSYIFNCGQLIQQDGFLQSQITVEEVERMLVTLFQDMAAPMRKALHHTNSFSYGVNANALGSLLFGST